MFYGLLHPPVFLTVPLKSPLYDLDLAFGVIPYKPIFPIHLLTTLNPSLFKYLSTLDI